MSNSVENMTHMSYNDCRKIFYTEEIKYEEKN